MKDEQIYGRLSIYLFISCSLQEQGGRLEKTGYLVHLMLKMSLMTLTKSLLCKDKTTGYSWDYHEKRPVKPAVSSTWMFLERLGRKERMNYWLLSGFQCSHALGKCTHWALSQYTKKNHPRRRAWGPYAATTLNFKGSSAKPKLRLLSLTLDFVLFEHPLVTAKLGWNLSVVGTHNPKT